MTLEEFNMIKEVLDKFGIPYEEGKYYSPNSELIVGSWLTIKEYDIDTDELSECDIEYNKS